MAQAELKAKFSEAVADDFVSALGLSPPNPFSSPLRSRAILPGGEIEVVLAGTTQMQIAELTSQFETHAVYRSIGSKMSKMHAMSHQAQRSNHASEDLYGGGKARKAAMKASWGISK